MARPAHDAVFVEEAAALRPRLERCARVLRPGSGPRSGRTDFADADLAVEQALAATYPLGADGDRTVAAFRALLGAPWSTGRRAREPAARIELRDVEGARSGELSEALAALGPTAQTVVVLSLVGELLPAEVGRIVGLSLASVDEVLDDALAQLGQDGYGSGADLAHSIRLLAGPDDPGASARAGIGDLARGRRLARRRDWRRVVTTAAVVGAVVVGGGTLVRVALPDQVTDVPPATSPSAPTVPSRSAGGVPDPSQSYGCDPTHPDCQVLSTARWRSRVSAVIVEHLDRRRSYFTAMTWGLLPDARSASYWGGRGGALSTGLSRGTAGGTQVTLQIATDEKYAERCGAQIRMRCTSLNTMDGNTYRVAGTSVATGGVEVQYIADEDRIITVVAQDAGEGRTLDVKAGDLIALVNDSRLGLPAR